METQQLQTKRNFTEISEAVKEPYQNFILDKVNDHCVRMAVMQGEYPWHYHNHTDELFMVLEGELKIEIKDNDTVVLKKGEFITIPARTIHKTSAIVRTVNLTFERKAEDTIFVD